MRIALIVTSLTEGGSQRVAATLANAWTRLGHTVCVLTFEPSGTRPDFALEPQVELRQLDLTGESGNPIAAATRNLRRIGVLRRELIRWRSDVTVALITAPNILAILAGLGQRWPTVISERVHPAHAPIARAWVWLRRRLYRRADAVVVQSRDVACWFAETLALEAVVIANPVDLDTFRAQPPPRNKPRYRALAAGRLIPQKGFDLLIEAFARVAAAHPDWDLMIHGEGEERARLDRRVAELGLTHRVMLAGATPDVAQAYAQADLFVHPARYEGSPNVVQEALAVGRPVIATDCPGATAEILGQGRYGVLVRSEDVDALADALARLFADGGARAALAGAAPQAVAACSSPLVAQRWLELFEAVIKARRGSNGR